MARPIKIHEEALFRVMKKSLKPLEVSMSQVSKSFTSQTVENKLEGKRAEKIKHENEKEQTGLLGAISNALKDRKENKGSSPTGGLGKGLFTFLKNHWGKILGGLGIAAALTMDAKDIMTAINSLETIMTIDFWEKYGGWIAGGLITALTLASWAPIGLTIGGAVLKYMLGKKLLEQFGKKLIAQTAATAAAATATTTAAAAGTGVIASKALSTEKLAKASKASRLMPILGMAGKILGWTYVAYTAGSAIKQNFFDDKSAGKDFGDKIKGTLGSFVSKFTNGLIKEETVTGLIDNITQGIKSGAESLVMTLVGVIKTTEKIIKNFDLDREIKRLKDARLDPVKKGDIAAIDAEMQHTENAMDANVNNAETYKKLALKHKKLRKKREDYWDKDQTRESSRTGLSSDAQTKVNLLGGMLGGFNVTSGFRDKDRGDDAMLKSKSDFSKIYSEQTRKGITDFGTPGSDERKAAISQMRLNGFQSQHEHGNAIDFSYPRGFGPGNFPSLHSAITYAFPGSTLLKEKDHLHMSFNQENTGAELGRIQSRVRQMGNSLNNAQTERASTQNVNGSTPVVINNVSNSNSNIGSSTVVMNQLVRSKQYTV